jgi:quercetin dioxygenase-like cupin family protein
VPHHPTVVALLTLLLVAPALAQSPGSPSVGRPVRTVMASSRLASVVDAPLHMRLLRVTVPAGQSAVSTGATGMLYVLSGALDIMLGADRRALAEGAALFLPAGQRVTLAATPAAPAVALHFVLGSAAELEQTGAARPATVTELYRTREPLPSLKPGPYEFSMTRVTVEKGVPKPPMHHRSGAALYYVLAGTWAIHIDGGKSEPRTRGNVQLEPNGFVHTWEIGGEATGILLQANISPEGTPEIIFLQPR